MCAASDASSSSATDRPPIGSRSSATFTGRPKAFAALDGKGQLVLERDIKTLLEDMNTAEATSLVVPGEYLEVVVTKR